MRPGPARSSRSPPGRCRHRCMACRAAGRRTARRGPRGERREEEGHRGWSLGHGVAERGGGPVLLDDPVAVAGAGGDQALHRVTGLAGRRSVEGGITEGEDTAVRGHQPVAPPVRRGVHAHDGLVEGEGSGRTVEGGIAKGKDAPVGRHQPVALPVGCHLHPHDGLVEDDVAGRPVEGGVAVGEDRRRRPPSSSRPGRGWPPCPRWAC